METSRAKICYFIMILFLTSCVKENTILVDNTNSNVSKSISKEGMMKFGKELRDPYAFENIKKAYNSLLQSKGDIPDLDLKPTHLYIRFLPKNEKELLFLKKDTTLVLFDFPLNYEIENMGTYYHDPSIADSLITYQYCVVKTDYNIPSIDHELIYEVFLPPDSSETKGSVDLAHFYAQLEFESIKLTGNLPKDNGDTKGLFPSLWTPKGRIMVQDDIIGLIPLQYASVHARWFTHIETTLTDSEGYFQAERFRYEVNYSIKWERAHYDIRNGVLLQAWYNGPKMKGDWNLDITGGESIMYATIHRAAYKHFYGDNLGINRPILPTGKTKICYRDGDGTGVFWGDWSATGILPDIQVWGRQDGIYKNTNHIFGTTIHELAHQAHSQNLGNIQYWQVSKIIYESWADAVEWALSNDEYNNLGSKYGIVSGLYYNHIYNTHYSWPSVLDKAYSPIFIDLMDNINQRNFSSNLPNDLISGYSLSYLNYYILRESYGISSLYRQIMSNKISGVTDEQINNLFEFYW